MITIDINAKVGKNNNDLRFANGYGERLKELWDFTEMVITSTFLNFYFFFPYKDIHKGTWVSPDAKTKTQIEHVLINSQFRDSITHRRVMSSVNVTNDHYLCSVLNH